VAVCAAARMAEVDAALPEGVVGAGVMVDGGRSWWEARGSAAHRALYRRIPLRLSAPRTGRDGPPQAAVRCGVKGELAHLHAAVRHGMRTCAAASCGATAWERGQARAGRNRDFQPLRSPELPDLHVLGPPPPHCGRLSESIQARYSAPDRLDRESRFSSLRSRRG
jgi:hypothetical protein